MKRRSTKGVRSRAARWISTVLVGTSVVALASVTVPVASAADRPHRGERFRAEVEGTVGDPVCDQTGCFRPATAQGRATRLGKATVSYKIYADPTTSPCVTLRGTREFTAKDGTLSMQTSGLGCPIGDTGFLDIHYVWSVTGGTGKFANATGSGTESLKTDATFPHFVEHYAGRVDF